jgi:hypothetical protein
MGKFAELCKGKTMGAFFLLLLPAGKTLNHLEKDEPFNWAETFTGRHFFVLKSRVPQGIPNRRPDS